MNLLVTEQHVIGYQRNGVVLVRNLFDSDWLNVLANGIEQILTLNSGAGFGESTHV